MKTVTASGWIRVTKRNPCPVCQKPDWCLICQDGQAAICARIQSDRPAGNQGAGWLHRLTSEYRAPRLPAPATPKNLLPSAPIDHRDAVYRALLGELTLSQPHRENLLSRGLTLEDITRLGYKTLPLAGRAAIVASLTKSLKVGGVPGFWFDAGTVRLAGAPGILLPVRDTQGRIQAMQIRCDHADGGGKYRWLSSASKPLGCSPGAPCHVARPFVVTESNEAWVTEGCLKADISALKLNSLVLAVPGVSNWHGIVSIVRELKPSRVFVAYDADRFTNELVQHYQGLLVRALLKSGLRVLVADWSRQHKGLDDVLMAEAL